MCNVNTVVFNDSTCGLVVSSDEISLSTLDSSLVVLERLVQMVYVSISIISNEDLKAQLALNLNDSSVDHSDWHYHYAFDVLSPLCRYALPPFLLRKSVSWSFWYIFYAGCSNLGGIYGFFFGLNLKIELKRTILLFLFLVLFSHSPSFCSVSFCTRRKRIHRLIGVQASGGGPVEVLASTSGLAKFWASSGGLAEAQASNGGLKNLQASGGGYRKLWALGGGPTEVRALGGGPAKLQASSGGKVKVWAIGGGLGELRASGDGPTKLHAVVEVEQGGKSDLRSLS
ncbi:hypothetical protein MA16_Dca002908 [Dendrobium catenatum]|uniref:Uncharacterized protein n=1 Tax=Dendrobium catenatum TaxID=906689 RepID=A0A2I0X907_9ASPA|nr:hypothetical protein MA16_Dca002908 [Dendrobium catenatum]